MRALFLSLILLLAVWPSSLTQAAQDDVVWETTDNDSCLAAKKQDRIVGIYRSTPNPFKPYIEQLFSPAGQQVLLDSPEDHVHHHGLMFALSVDGVSFWDESDNSGRQNVGETKIVADGVLTQKLRWIDPQDNVKLNEQRQIRIRQTDQATVLSWQSKLSLPESLDKVELVGNHYYGLGMRLHPSFDGIAKFGFPEGSVGEPVRGTEKLTRANWVACVGSVDKKPVTVVMLSHPKNRRHPAWWFTMDKAFAYQAATMNLWKQPLTLDHGDTLTLDFGVVLLDGEASTEQIESIYTKWVSSI